MLYGAHSPRNRCASVSAAAGSFAARATPSSSLVLLDHARMLQIRSLVRRLLNYRLSDAVSAHVAPRNGGASVSGAVVAYEASGTLSRSFARWHRAWMQANAVSQRAAWVLVPRSLIYSASNAYRWAGGAENAAHLFRRQLGCLQRMGH